MNTPMTVPDAGIDDPDVPNHSMAANAATLWQTNCTTRIRNITLQLHWGALPNVTLYQAAWLLLDADPDNPPVRLAHSTASPYYHHAQLLNRLECEVAAGTLRPLPSRRPPPMPRFNLVNILTRTVEIGVYKEAATELLALTRLPTSNRAPETARSRLDDRMDWHREFAASRDSCDKQVIPEKNPAKKPRRSHVGAKANLRLAMTRYKYDPDFIAFVTHQYSKPTYKLTSTMLRQDRRALNIELQAGRPPRK